MDMELILYPGLLVAAIVFILNWFTKGELD